MTPEQPLGPPPRKARPERAIRNVRRAYRSIFALIVFVFAGWAALDGWRLYELSNGTVSANATITKKTIVPSNMPHATPGHADHRLEYTFTPEEGAPIVDVASVSSEVYEAAAEGGRATVIYLPANPSVDHWLGNNESARTHPRFMMFCRGWAAIIALIVLVMIERPLRAEVWLARHGIAVQGRILATGKGRRKRSKPWIKYAFQSASGQAIEGKSFVPRATPAAALTPDGTIEVLYDPRNPKRSRARLAMKSVEFGV